MGSGEMGGAASDTPCSWQLFEGQENRLMFAGPSPALVLLLGFGSAGQDNVRQGPQGWAWCLLEPQSCS